MEQITERIARLRALMEERGIDAYVVPTSDYHDSEYVGEHFACRQYITGFTGSAGTAVITRTWAGLWTDGRYFVQAAAELELEQRNLQSLQVRFQQGTASQTQIENQQYTVQLKELALQTADLNLFQTMETYDWAVNGLASVS